MGAPSFSEMVPLFNLRAVVGGVGQISGKNQGPETRTETVPGAGILSAIRVQKRRLARRWEIPRDFAKLMRKSRTRHQSPKWLFFFKLI